jgi:prepilin-type N-terminal cleavage/methylation domain-containing protein
MIRSLRKNSDSNLLEESKARVSHPRRTGGFTLVELIIVVAIFGVVVGAIYTVFVRSNRVYISQEEVVAAQQEARTALEILGREIRMAGLIAADNQPGGTYPISAGAWGGGADDAIEVASEDTGNGITTLAFKSDLVEGDNQTDAVRYVYYWDTHVDTSKRRNLYRQSKIWDGPSSSWTNDTGEQLFLKNISGLNLTYQLAGSPPPTSTNPADPSDIRAVDIRVTAQTQNQVEPYEGGKSTRFRTLRSLIQVRNMAF